MAVLGHHGSLFIYDAGASKLRHALIEDPSRILALRFEGKDKVASVDNRLTTRCYDLRSGEEDHRLSVKLDDQEHPFVSLDGKIACLLKHRRVRFVDLVLGKELGNQELGKGKQAVSAALSASADRCAILTTGAEDEIQVWNVSTCKCEQTFHSEWRIGALCFTPNGRQIIATTTDRVHVLDLEKGKFIREFAAKNKPDRGSVQLQMAAVSPDSSLLAVREVFRHPAPPPDRMRISGDTPPDEWSIRLWEFKSGKEIDLIKNSGSDGPIVFSPDMELLFTGARMWFLGKKQEEAYFGAGSYAWSADEKLMATGDHQGAVTIWDLKKLRARK